MSRPDTGMRILVIGSIPPYPGGAEISLGHLIDGFSRQGHAVSCISPVSDPLARDCAAFDRLHPHLGIHRYRMPEPDYLPYRHDPEFAAREKREIETLFPRVVERFRPHLVLSGRDSFVPIAIPLAAAEGLPCVQLLRGSPTAQIIEGSYPEHLAESFLEQLEQADRVIAVSEFMAASMRGRGIGEAFCIPNAVDTERFSPGEKNENLLSRMGFPDGARVVLSPSNLLPRKRPQDLLRAAETVVGKHPDLYFGFLGQGPDAERFADKVSRSPARTNVRLLGWQAYAEMPGLLNAADLVVMTSESEGMSRACIESMACGRTLIASDIAPARELIDDGRNGLIYPLGDCDALADRIDWALTHSDACRRIEKQARLDMLERNYGPIIDRYLEALRSLF